MYIFPAALCLQLEQVHFKDLTLFRLMTRSCQRVLLMVTSSKGGLSAPRDMWEDGSRARISQQWLITPTSGSCQDTKQGSSQCFFLFFDNIPITKTLFSQPAPAELTCLLMCMYHPVKISRFAASPSAPSVWYGDTLTCLLLTRMQTVQGTSARQGYIGTSHSEDPFMFKKSLIPPPLITAL